MGDGLNLVDATQLLEKYCQTPNFKSVLEVEGASHLRIWHTVTALQNLLAVFTTTFFTPILEKRVLELTSRILELEKQGWSQTQSSFQVDGMRYDIINVVEFIRQSVGHYPFIYWNGQRVVRYLGPFRTPSPEPAEHSRRLTPQPHDVHMDTLLLMRSVLKK